MGMPSGLTYRITVEGMQGEEKAERLGSISIAHANQRHSRDTFLSEAARANGALRLPPSLFAGRACGP